MSIDTKRLLRGSESAVRAYLHDRGVPFDVILHPRASSAIDEAHAIGVAEDDVVKTVVIDHARGRALAIVPSSRKLDMRRVRVALNDPHAALASEREIRSAFPLYELGAIPPIGSLLDTRALLDPAVFEHDTVVFAAGTQTESLRVRAEDLFKGDDIDVVRITRGPDGEHDRDDEFD